MASLRQLLLVLLAIVARPWIWLAVVGFGLSPGFQVPWQLMTPSATLTPVVIVPGPTVSPNGGADFRQLELRGTGPDNAVLLPPLPALESCCIGWKHLEQNLDTLAAGSPRLHTLALETYPEFQFTPGMLAALRQMPALRRVSVAAAISPDDEPAMTRQVAELQRAVPGVRSCPGRYSTKRVAVVGYATVSLAAISFGFWFQAASLLATPLAWMLPRRFPPHAVWPIAVAAAGGAAVVILGRSCGVAWLPALGLTLFASGVGLYGPVWGDTPGWPGRLTRLAIGADYACGLLLIGTFLGTPVTADRWLTGYEPATALALVVMAATGLGWKIARVARLPRIAAEGGNEAAVASSIGGGQSGAAAARADRTDRRWWRPDVAIDNQLARPLPTASPAAAAFADLLRRPQSRLQILLMVGFMVIASGVFAALPAFRSGSDAPSRPSVAATIAGVVILAAAAGLAAAVGEASLHIWYGGSLRWWRSLAGAVILSFVGLAIRAAVFRRLEDREIG